MDKVSHYFAELRCVMLMLMLLDEMKEMDINENADKNVIHHRLSCAWQTSETETDFWCIWKCDFNAWSFVKLHILSQVTNKCNYGCSVNVINYVMAILHKLHAPLRVRNTDRDYRAFGLLALDACLIFIILHFGWKCNGKTSFKFVLISHIPFD